MLMIDIDCFKDYNDDYGHQAGEYAANVRGGKTERL